MFTILFLVFVIVVAIQIGYYGILFTPFSFMSKQKKSTIEKPISVIIACKNEEKNIPQIIAYLSTQRHPNFEVIMVDDASTDNTLSIMKEVVKLHTNISYISIPKTATYNGNKKNVVTLAIQKASFENLLFTDADCIPNSDNWISQMSKQLDTKKQLLLGYGGYKKSRGWFNKLVRYETVLTAWQYFSYAKIGLPYMGVGRNIAYTKSLFKKANGFESHQHITSGDDDLFVNQIGNKQNTAICWEQDTHTLSEPKKTLAEWLHQKRRHITTANTYKPIHQFLLGLFYLSQLFFFILLFILLFKGVYVQFVLLLVGIRYLFFFISFIPTANKFNEKDLIISVPFLELFLILLQLRIFITNLFGSPTKW